MIQHKTMPIPEIIDRVTAIARKYNVSDWIYLAHSHMEMLLNAAILTSLYVDAQTSIHSLKKLMKSLPYAELTFLTTMKYVVIYSGRIWTNMESKYFNRYQSLCKSLANLQLSRGADIE